MTQPRGRGGKKSRERSKVTSLLLEALTRKVSTLQEELETSASSQSSSQGSLKAKENLRTQLILTIEKLQTQWEQLEQEYTQQALGVLRSSNTRGSGKNHAALTSGKG
ncbi:hypothetical protein Pmani_004980 [Petrolisthes manimaculis]|uniref:Uncharacterized protein n=1 Tax=Petrolisthes manimaculis TaxID=1843537 RepID=A0AAE1UND8_9EUCA|nr:hypothetical protein Pmani_004980 [Petrolisthes manimaculis]